MKKHLDAIKKKMEVDVKKEHKSFYDAYWFGYIHGMNDAGSLSDEESDELINYKDSLFYPGTEVLRHSEAPKKGLLQQTPKKNTIKHTVPLLWHGERKMSNGNHKNQ